MDTHAAGSVSAPEIAEGANAQAAGHDVDAFEQQMGVAATQMAGDDPTRPTVRRPYGAPQLPELPTTPIPLGTPREVEIPEALQRQLTRLDARAQQATSVSDQFMTVDAGRRDHGAEIHEAAIAAYQHPDASMHSLNTAYQADRQSEHTSRRSHRFTRWARQASAPRAVERATTATTGTPNAAMMATVIRSDPRTQNSYERRFVGYALQDGLDSLTDSDPNYQIDRQAGSTIQPRPGTEEATQHHFGSTFSTAHPAAVRDLLQDVGIPNLQTRREYGVRVVAADPPLPEPQLPAFSADSPPPYPGTNPPPYRP